MLHDVNLALIAASQVYQICQKDLIRATIDCNIFASPHYLLAKGDSNNLVPKLLMLLLVLMSYTIFIYILFCCRLVMRHCVACGVYSRIARIMGPTWTLLSGLRNWAAVKVNVWRPNWRLLGVVFFLTTPGEFIEDTHRTRSCRAYVKQMHIGLRILYLYWFKKYCTQNIFWYLLVCQPFYVIINVMVIFI